MLYYWHCVVCAEVMLVTRVRVIGMTMADQRPLDRLPGVEVDIGLRAENPFIRKLK